MDRKWVQFVDKARKEQGAYLSVWKSGLLGISVGAGQVDPARAAGADGNGMRRRGATVAGESDE